MPTKTPAAGNSFPKARKKAPPMFKSAVKISNPHADMVRKSKAPFSTGNTEAQKPVKTAMQRPTQPITKA